MLTELADVKRTRRRRSAIAEHLPRQAVAIVKAAGDRVGPHVAVFFRVEHRQLRFLRGTDAAFGIENDDAGMRDAVKGVRHGAAGIARCGGQHRERIIAGVERCHQPGHRPRADILERERGTVKQLEGENSRFHFHEGNRKIQRFDDNRLVGRRVELAAGVRAQRPVGDLGQRAGRQPRQLLRGPRLDPLRHVQAAVRRETFDERGMERDAFSLSKAARRHEAHVERTRAPCEAIGDT